MNHPGLHITAYDDDKVEYYNIGRQNFSSNDIGEFKASVMISKINRTFGLRWKAVNQKFDISLKKPRTANIFITCTDNASFRYDFDTFF